MYTYYAFTKNWIMSNLFGLAVAFNSLEVFPSLFIKLSFWGGRVDYSIFNWIRLWLDSCSWEDYSSMIFSLSLGQMSWSPLP
jgi:hypothetical protein